MPRNVEWKARARDVERQRAVAAEIAGRPGEILRQVDTFFRVPHGRLKLREFEPGRGELIFYVRPDAAAARASEFTVVPTADPASLRAALAGALGVRGEVRKRRLLYLVGTTRIHLDEVEGLGSFLEVEVVLAVGETGEEGMRRAEELRERLGVRQEDLVDRAYVDLLADAGGSDPAARS